MGVNFFLKDFILHSPGLTSNSRSSGLFKLLYFVLNYQNAFITKSDKTLQLNAMFRQEMQMFKCSKPLMGNYEGKHGC